MGGGHHLKVVILGHQLGGVHHRGGERLVLIHVVLRGLGMVLTGLLGAKLFIAGHVGRSSHVARIYGVTLGGLHGLLRLN